MTNFNEIAPGGVGAPAEGVNPATAQMEEGRSLPTVTPLADVPVPQLSDIALMLDTTVNMADLARGDLSQLMPQLPDTTSLWVHVDLVRAIVHLRKAVALVDKVTDQLAVAEDLNQLSLFVELPAWARKADSTVYPCCMSIGGHAPDCRLTDQAAQR